MNEEILRQLEELTRTTVFWMVVSALLLVFLLVNLIVLLRMRARSRKAEAWLNSEFRAIESRQAALARQIASGPPTLAARAAAAKAQRQTQPPPSAPARETPARPPSVDTPSPFFDPVATLNELLTGNQPYNLIEAVRAIEPRLTMERLTPRATGNLFDRKVLLDPGGDGLFAIIQDDEAQLYPNYSRFSATLDPKPLFDGARHGSRIHAILQPALLTRQPDGSWLLTQKGRVQMLQGNDR